MEHVREEPVWGRIGGLVIKIIVPSDRGLEVGCVGDYSMLLSKLWLVNYEYSNTYCSFLRQLKKWLTSSCLFSLW